MTNKPQPLTLTLGGQGQFLKLLRHAVTLTSPHKKEYLQSNRLHQAICPFSKWTALHLISRYKELNDLAAVFVNLNVDINAPDDNQRTPLHLAAMYGNNEIVKSLLDFGANPDARDSLGSSPLHTSAEYDEEPEVRLLLAHGTDPNARDNRQKTPLHHAGWSGNKEIGILLLRAGAEFSAQDDAGLIPGHFLGSSVNAKRQEWVQTMRAWIGSPKCV